jgi:hypothetical protein
MKTGACCCDDRSNFVAGESLAAQFEPGLKTFVMFAAFQQLQGLNQTRFGKSFFTVKFVIKS